MKVLPPLLDTTKEGRRVYELNAVINQRQITRIHIDSHYEQEHSSYMTDEMIYNFALQLIKEEKWEYEEKDGEWEYYSAHPLFLNDWRAYEMIWCLKGNTNFLGIITCYRRSKYDKDHEKQ